MNHITVRLPDWLRLETAEKAAKRLLSVSAYVREVLLNASERSEPTTIVSHDLVDRSSKRVEPTTIVSPSVPAASQVAITARSDVEPRSSLDVTAEERAAYAAKRAEADRKRRVLLAAMGIAHPEGTHLPATFFPGEADFMKAHPEFAI